MPIVDSEPNSIDGCGPVSEAHCDRNVALGLSFRRKKGFS